jgi:hypothetical protein
MSGEESRRNRRDWVILAGLVLVINLLTLLFQKVPGYMDAEYYYTGALNLFRGNGFTEQYVWNTLSLPVGLPSASHLYWMPLPSIFAAVGLWLGQQESYYLARIPFIVLTICIPILTYELTRRMGGDSKTAFIAGLMAVLPGVYLVYLNLVEAFSPYMLVGGFICFLIFNVLSKNEEKLPVGPFLLLGVLSALMHLTRADGILWLGFCGLIPTYWLLIRKQWKNGLFTGVLLLLSYSLIMFPWYARNWQLFHHLFPPGNQYTLYLTTYNDNFMYPVNQITSQRWLMSGWGAILSDRMKALLSNGLTSWMIQFQIILIPFFILWIKDHWKESFVRWLLICYLIQFGFMTFIFPYAGMRGGFLHSGAAFQVVFWAGSGMGLFAAIRWLMEKRAQFDERIPVILSGGVVLILGIITVMMYQQKVLGNPITLDHWQAGAEEYASLNEELLNHGISPTASVMINNPPGFYLASGRTAVVVPNADINGVIALADQYDIDFLILDTHIVSALAPFYEAGESIDGLVYQFSYGDFKIFSFEQGMP